MENKLITFASYNTAAEAYLVKTLLEDNEIPVAIFDELSVNMAPGYNHVLGGIKVKIPEQYLEKALELFDNSKQKEQPLPAKCPECNSENIKQRKILATLNLIWSTLTFSPTILFPQIFKCSDCSNKWNN